MQAPKIPLTAPPWKWSHLSLLSNSGSWVSCRFATLLKKRSSSGILHSSPEITQTIPSIQCYNNTNLQLLYKPSFTLYLKIELSNSFSSFWMNSQASQQQLYYTILQHSLLWGFAPRIFSHGGTASLHYFAIDHLHNYQFYQKPTKWTEIRISHSFNPNRNTRLPVPKLTNEMQYHKPRSNPK